MSEPKACPCGGQVYVGELRFTGETQWCVGCLGCGRAAKRATKEAAISAWNMTATDKPEGIIAGGEQVRAKASEPQPVAGGGEEILPCPFGCATSRPYVRVAYAQGSGHFPEVTCDECGAHNPPTENDTEAEAVAAWNRRPLLSSPRVEGERLKKAVEIALDESMKAPQSQDHPWDRGYRAGAAAVWSKLSALSLQVE